jgi:hypothetical protein
MDIQDAGLIVDRRDARPITDRRRAPAVSLPTGLVLELVGIAGTLEAHADGIESHFILTARSLRTRAAALRAIAESANI